MALFLSLVNGIGRMLSSSGTALYDQQIAIVSGTPASANQMTGPVTAGSPVTLPASQTYQGAELQVSLNGLQLEPVGDYSYYGTGAPYTQVAFTFALLVTDVVDFRIVRSLN